MYSFEQAIVVDVSLSTAYTAWAHFEAFPAFMEGVQEVQHLEDGHLHWQAEVGGRLREWEAEIVEQTPDRRVAWRSLTGPHHAAIVSLRVMAADRTEVTLHVEYAPEGEIAVPADLHTALARRLTGDLIRFKALVEGRP